MIKEIRTEKFEGLAVLVPDDAEAWINSEIKDYLHVGDIHGDAHSIKLPYDYVWIGKATELTEEQCADIVDSEDGILRGLYGTCYKEYTKTKGFAPHFNNSKRSFASLMQSLECYAANPYSDPNERYRCRDCADSDGLCCNEEMIKYCDPDIHLEKYNEAQSNTGTWIILNKL